MRALLAPACGVVHEACTEILHRCVCWNGLQSASQQQLPWPCSSSSSSSSTLQQHTAQLQQQRGKHTVRMVLLKVNTLATWLIAICHVPQLSITCVEPVSLQIGMKTSTPSVSLCLFGGHQHAVRCTTIITLFRGPQGFVVYRIMNTWAAEETLWKSRLVMPGRHSSPRAKQTMQCPRSSNSSRCVHQQAWPKHQQQHR